MKKLRLFITILILLVLSGCSVEYNLTINEDYTINETVIASEETNRMESLTRLKGKQAISYLYDMYKRDNKDVELDYRNESKYTYATAYTSHDNINEYANNFTSDVFNKAIVEKKDNVTTLTLNQSQKLSNDDSYALVYDDIKINITIPFKVTQNNADSVNGNVYTWNIKKGKDLKTIKVSYEEGSKKNNVNVKTKNKTYNIKYSVIIIGILIFVIVFIILFVYIKNKKNNVV